MLVKVVPRRWQAQKKYINFLRKSTHISSAILKKYQEFVSYQTRVGDWLEDGLERLERPNAEPADNAGSRRSKGRTRLVEFLAVCRWEAGRKLDAFVERPVAGQSRGGHEEVPDTHKPELQPQPQPQPQTRATTASEPRAPHVSEGPEDATFKHLLEVKAVRQKGQMWKRSRAKQLKRRSARLPSFRRKAKYRTEESASQAPRQLKGRLCQCCAGRSERAKGLRKQPEKLVKMLKFGSKKKEDGPHSFTW